MYTKAVDLKEFYATLRGKVVQRVIRRRIRKMWPNVKDDRVVGIGYAVPYLNAFFGDADRVSCFLPKSQGAIFWPKSGKGLVSVFDEDALPLESNSVDRVLIIHTKNSAESLSAVLNEAWRVLVGQGRIMVVLPNRAGIWARIDNNPFGRGVPYSAGQIKDMLKEHMFIPEDEERSLFFPPTNSRLILATARVWESLGRKLFNACGGVNIVEASKQLYVGTAVPVSNKQGSKSFIAVTTPSTSSSVGKAFK